MSILEQVQEDVKTAMKAGEKERVGQLRMLVNALQAEEKEGNGDEVAALQRERKRRLDAAEALKEGDRTEQAAAEEDDAAGPGDAAVARKSADQNQAVGDEAGERSGVLATAGGAEYDRK